MHQRPECEFQNPMSVVFKQWQEEWVPCFANKIISAMKPGIL
jgi:hypothetical protein